MLIILLFAAIGFCVSSYGFFIQQQLRKNPNYKPLCDISEAVSCTKPFESLYSKLLGFSNTILGIIFYTVVFIAALFGYAQFVFLLSFGAIITSGWFAYILYFKIKTFCLICTIIYIVNIGLFVASIRS